MHDALGQSSLLLLPFLLQCDPSLLLFLLLLSPQVRRLTGYDRVMVYRFHEDEHGEVVAEDRRPDWEPYLGLHYPATDVPRAARLVFMKTGKRAIFDSAETPVRGSTGSAWWMLSAGINVCNLHCGVC